MSAVSRSSTAFRGMGVQVSDALVISLMLQPSTGVDNHVGVGSRLLEAVDKKLIMKNIYLYKGIIEATCNSFFLFFFFM